MDLHVVRRPLQRAFPPSHLFLQTAIRHNFFVVCSFLRRNQQKSPLGSLDRWNRHLVESYNHENGYRLRLHHSWIQRSRRLLLRRFHRNWNYKECHPLVPVEHHLLSDPLLHNDRTLPFVPGLSILHMLQSWRALLRSEHGGAITDKTVFTYSSLNLSSACFFSSSLLEDHLSGCHLTAPLR